MYYATPKEVEVEMDTIPTKSFDLNAIEAALAAQKIPDLKGLPAMEALVLLEEKGVKVTLKGKGRVKRQSLASGTEIKANMHIILNLS